MSRRWCRVIRLRNQNTGAMLVLTMMLIGLVWFAMLAFSNSTLYALRGSSNYLGSERAAAAAESGLVYAVAELKKDADWEPRDSYYKLKQTEDRFRLEFFDIGRSPLVVPDDCVLVRSTGVSRSGRSRRAAAVIKVGKGGGTLFDYALFGDGITSNGGIRIDAFDSRTGNRVLGAADIATNSIEKGSIRLNSSALVDGTVWAGEGGNIDDTTQFPGRTWGTDNVVWKNWSVTTEGEKQLAGQVELPEVDIPDGSKKDEKIKLNWKGGQVEPGMYEELQATSTGVAELTPGQYYFDSVKLSGSASLAVAGDQPAIIYVRDKLQITGGSLSNSSKTPRNLIFVLGPGADVNIAGGAEAYAVFYGPKAEIKITGGSRVYGAAVAEEINLSGGPSFTYDVSLRDLPPAIPGLKGGGSGGAVSVVSWRRY